MSKDSIPPMPSGDDEEARFMQWVWRVCSQKFIDTPGLRWEERGDSVRAWPKISVAPPSARLFHPFKIYNAAHISDPTKSWRTFQVRGGYIGHRPKKCEPIGTFLDFYGTYILGGTHNYEQIIELSGNSADFGGGWDGIVSAGQGVYDWFTPSKVAPSPTVVNLADTGDFTAEGPAQFVLMDTPDDVGQIAAAFWNEIEEFEVSASVWDLRVKIKARMITSNNGDSTGRTQNLFPDACENIIPIGIVATGIGSATGEEPPYPAETTGQFNIDQILNNHVYGRPYSHYRGNWDDDTLSGQTFYPGDIVVQDYTVGPDDWQKVGMAFDYSVQTDGPNDNPAAWQIIGDFEV
jgi:hypothetical protein